MNPLQSASTPTSGSTGAFSNVLPQMGQQATQQLTQQATTTLLSGFQGRPAQGGLPTSTQPGFSQQMSTPMQATQPFSQSGMLSQQPQQLTGAGFSGPGLTPSQPASQAYVSSSHQPWRSSPTTTSTATMPSTSSSTSYSQTSIPTGFSQPNTPYKFSDYYTSFLNSRLSSESQATSSSPAQLTQPSSSLTSSMTPTVSSSYQPQSSLVETGRATSPSAFSSQQQQQTTALPRTYPQFTESGRVAPLQSQQQYYVTGQPTQPAGVLSARPTVHYTAPSMELREKPAVIQEVIRPGVREEIQPVIHRDREQTEIREEIQPVYEKSVRPVQYEEKTLTPQYRSETLGNMTPIIAPGPMGSTTIAPEHKEMLVKPAIIEETIHKKIMEEVQPIIHRETLAPKVVHETKPIYEKVIESPVVNYTVLPARYGGAQSTFSPEFRALSVPIKEGPTLRETIAPQQGFQGQQQFMGTGDMKKYEQERIFRDNMAPGFVQRY